MNLQLICALCNIYDKKDLVLHNKNLKLALNQQQQQQRQSGNPA